MDDMQDRVRRSLRSEWESTHQLMVEMLTVLRHMDSADQRGAVSSAKITLQRGTVDIAVHAYTGSDIREAEAEALGSYRRIILALNQDGVAGFEKTLEALQR